MSYSLETAQSLHPKKIVLLTGHKAKEIREVFREEKVVWALQKKQLGTAHAVLSGLAALRSFRGLLFILSADVPLLKPETLKGMQELLLGEEGSLVLLTAKRKDPTGYGRIVRNERGEVERIVEEKEANETERELGEINCGIYLARVGDILKPLQRVKRSPVKGEYYLTDLVTELNGEGKRVLSFEVSDSEEVLGINSQRDLARAEEVLQGRIRAEWMDRGVTLIDPSTIRIERGVTIEPSAIVHPGVILIGKTKIGRGAEIFPYSVIEESVVGEGARIGPFAHLRPGTVLSPGAHVGNFVEIKGSRLGVGSKANHLAYLGDAIIGAGANIGAGTITCNYDGFKKNKTIVGDGAFIGSDTQLVAPVKVGKKAWVGAGTTVTKNVPAGALAISRVKQENILDWRRKKKCYNG